MRISTRAVESITKDEEEMLEFFDASLDDEFHPYSSWILENGKFLNLNGRAHFWFTDDIINSGIDTKRIVEHAIKINDNKNPADHVVYPYALIPDGQITNIQRAVLEEELA